ncbi:MAG: TlpA family protein disulfide reductase, partial [Chloroflexota bacterium]
MGNGNMEIYKEDILEPKVVPNTIRVGRILAFVFLISLLTLVGWQLAKSQKGIVSTGVSPDFSLTSFDGNTISLSDLRGKVVILNFWASWCDPCREEAKYLENTWRKFQNQDVFFIGVDYVDIEKNALAYLDEFDITYFNGPDEGTKISQTYNIQGVPETFFIDKNGVIH